jgi:hypothetical protein
VSSSEPARLKVPRAGATLEIEVLDSSFQPVASGVGALDVALAPGIYEIRFREGLEHESQLHKIAPGDNVVSPPEFEPPSPAPIAETRTSQNYHQEAVLDATGAIGRDCSAPGPETGGLVVMVRNVRGQDALPFPAVEDDFVVVDEGLEPLDPTGEHWQRGAARSGADADWALWSRAVVPGGYALRFQSVTTAEVLYQSLWVDEGWQTMVFIPNTPDGPASELASVHVARAGEWTPFDEGSALAVALESVLDGLRAGRSVVPHDLAQLLEAKFVNPFLGIAAGHALVLDPNPSLSLLETVVANLERLVPASPDVVALGHRARYAGANVEPRDGVSWPPMMHMGYRALLRADANHPGVITDGSPAQEAAALVRLSGLWTTWAAKPTSEPTRTRGTTPAADAGDEPDPATERLLAYVDDAARIGRKSRGEILNEKSVQQLAKATVLPTATVRGAVQKLKGRL